ncbi:MAG: hypothetical protein ACLFTH_02885 [Candidatus Woesearchaeota archaeon]
MTSDENAVEKKTSSLAKTAQRLLYTGLLVGSFFLGEYVSPVEKVTNTVKYHNISAENGFPRDFRELDKVVVINDRNRAETYFGNVEDSVLHPVRPDYHTRRDVGKEVDSYLQRKFSRIDSLLGEYTNRWIGNIPGTIVERDTVCTDDSTSWLEEKLFRIKNYLNDASE